MHQLAFLPWWHGRPLLLLLTAATAVVAAATAVVAAATAAAATAAAAHHALNARGGVPKQNSASQVSGRGKARGNTQAASLCADEEEDESTQSNVSQFYTYHNSYSYFLPKAFLPPHNFQIPLFFIYSPLYY